MRQSYLKNAALLTGSDVVLRLAGMGLRIWLANELGGEGMGLYQLVLAVYSLFVTLATAGVSVAATRLMAEELSGPASAHGAARGMLRRLLAAGLVLGMFAAALQLATADLAARLWLGDVRAVGALRVSALGMPWMAVSAVLRGFFIARRHVAPNVFSQLTEQTVRIALVGLVSNDIPGAAAAARQARDLDPEDGVPYFILAQCYASSAGSCGGFAGLATYWAAYDTMAKAVELLPADSEYMEHAKSSLGKFRSVFPSSEECFFNELQEGARYTVTCGTAAGITTTVRAR